MNYRIGIRTQKPDECLIQFTSLTNKSESGQLVGRKVVLMRANKKFTGKIVGFHGKNGVVIARFKKGVPGQALGASVELVALPETSSNAT
jgi:large subunit ribosomal protein L35Ae